MKTAWATVMMMTLAATGAEAVDIDGKWGIGAGVFSNGGGEVTLIRGKSARSAWLFDVGAAGHDQTSTVTDPTQPDETRNSNAYFIRLGPGYRRFVRAAEEFSPYWDLHVRGTFSRAHDGGSGSDTRKTAGVGAEFSFGLEYFTRWHFSVAAHTSLVTANWFHMTEVYSPLAPREFSAHSTEVSIGLSPALFVRGYF